MANLPKRCMKEYGREISRRRFLSSTVKSTLTFAVLTKVAKAADNNPLPVPNHIFLNDFLTPFRQNNNLPALAAAVMKNGVVVASGAVGIRKVGDPAPVTMRDKFHLGSCTKAFTATLAAMLVEQGKIRWKSTLVEIFPERVTQLHDYLNVTLELLLWHRSGVPFAPPVGWWKAYTSWCSKNGIPPGAYPQGPMDPRIIKGRLGYVDLVLAQSPTFKPGTGTHYSNNAYIIAGCMIERVTGVPWEDLMRLRLFTPLGMTSAGFGPAPKQNQTNQPWGHHFKEGKYVPAYGDNPEVMGPSGTLHCALLDYLKFADLHASDGRRGPRLLNLVSSAKLHTPPAGQSYAMGWVSQKRPWAKTSVLVHNGSNTMNYFLVMVAPEIDLCLAVASNCARAGDFSQKDAAGNSPGKNTDQVLNEVANELGRKFAG